MIHADLIDLHLRSWRNSMVNEKGLYDRLKSENEDFKKWARLHHEIESRLSDLKRLKFMSSEEDPERKKLQKQKLIAKDHMQYIIDRYKKK